MECRRKREEERRGGRAARGTRAPLSLPWASCLSLLGMSLLSTVPRWSPLVRHQADSGQEAACGGREHTCICPPRNILQARRLGVAALRPTSSGGGCGRPHDKPHRHHGADDGVDDVHGRGSHDGRVRVPQTAGAWEVWAKPGRVCSGRPGRASAGRRSGGQQLQHRQRSHGCRAAILPPPPPPPSSHRRTAGQDGSAGAGPPDGWRDGSVVRREPPSASQ